MEGSFPDANARDEIGLQELPPDWASNEAVTRAAGEQWVSAATSAILVVPSVVTAHESASIGDKNILLNPRHPDYRNLRIVDLRPFRFDSRLFESPT